MASTDKWLCNNKVTMYDHDPADSTVATDVAWVDMRDYGGIVIAVFASALTGTGPVASGFKILANSASDGSGTDATIKTHLIATAVDAVGDYVFLECTAEEIRAAETSATGALRYVSANLDMQNAADEAVVTYIRHSPRWAQDGLTADVIA